MTDESASSSQGDRHRLAVVEWTVRHPVTTASGVLLLLLFGCIALVKLPVQLRPTIDRPVISVTTAYPGAAPQEVEQQVTDPIEEKINSVENLRKIVSVSQEGRSAITLEFDWGIDKDLAVIDVMRQVNQVTELPVDAELPVITATSSDEEQAIMYIAVFTELDPSYVREILDNEIQPRLMRIGGVGDVRFFGGQEREVRVVLDPEKLAARGLAIPDVREALLNTNLNIRSGDIEKGDERWIVRTVGEFRSLEEIAGTPIFSASGAYVLLGDVARIVVGFKDPEAFVRIDRRPANVLAVNKKSGGNTLKVAAGVHQELERLNRAYGSRGINFIVVYSDTDYIWDSIGNVVFSLSFGAVLAVGVLHLFLGSLRTVTVIGCAIPVSLVGTLSLLWGFDRSVNIISIAGLGFAGGMVIDNAVVVVENIVRHMEEGLPRLRAAVVGTSEVWGAIFASTATTLAVFVPVLFVHEEAGQLFRDIAYAISFAIGLSLLLSLSLIPSFAARATRVEKGRRETEKQVLRTWRIGIADGFMKHYMKLLDRILPSRRRCGLVVLSVLASAAALSLLLPPAEYLPPGNRNLILISMKIPPGLSLEAVDEIVVTLQDRYAAMPETDRMFAISLRDGPIIGVVVKDEYADEDKIQAALGKMWGMASDITQAQVFIFQASIFQRGVSGGKQIEIELRGDDIERLAEYSGRLESTARSVEGVIAIRSSLELGNPELRIALDLQRLKELGISTRLVGEAVEVMVDGKRTGVFRAGGREDEVDLTVIGDRKISRDREALERTPVWSDASQVVPLSSVGRIISTTGPTRIEHTDLARSITLTVFVDKEIPIQPVIENINAILDSEIRPELPPGYSVRLTGTADDLARTVEALSGAFLVAILISYLLMASLFESFLWPVVVILVVPVGMVGAIFGVVSTGEQLNVITMLGFIILAGTVINSAILIVHQTLNFKAEGMDLLGALRASARSRVRPIFMTTTTSVAGMAPLAFGTGPGSELYRGLGASVLFGLALSTIVILVFTPALVALVAGPKRGSSRSPIS